MANKKFNRLTLLALLAGFGLTACSSEVFAKPSDYDDPIIQVAGDDIYNNIMSVVYDGIHEGTLASDVLDEVLYQYSVSVFGRYNKVSSPKHNELAKETTLKEAVKSAKGDKTVANKFIKEHKAYWDTDAKGNRVLDGRSEDVASDTEIARLISKWDSIEDRIAEKLYASIKGGSYSYRNEFSEKQFLVSLRTSMKKVADYKDPTTVVYEPQLLLPSVEEKDVFDNFLHRDNYQPNAGLDQDESSNKLTYIEDEIIPQIYRTLLTEQYLLDETYNTLGRSYARKVNILSITNNDNYPKAAPYLMNYFVDSYINAGEEITLDTFKAVSNAWKGVDIVADSLEETLLKNSKGFEYDATLGYYKGTEYGDMMDDFAKISSDPLLTDTSIESDFTNSGNYSVETGKKIKADNIRLKDFVTNGWYIKNGGLSEFTTFRERLFNIGVSNALDNAEVKDRITDTGYDASVDFNQYVAKINGKFYLKASSSEQGQDGSDILFYNADSKTYYIVQIEEAVSSTKLSKTSDKNYAHIKGQDGEKFMEDTVNEVNKVVSDNDSYNTLAKKHWLEEMNLEYHDDVIYDYFKTNFPELFED